MFNDPTTLLQMVRQEQSRRIAVATQVPRRRVFFRRRRGCD
jgi:hypothetical protein